MALVLGRLFKIHPDFIAMVVDILVSLEDTENCFVVLVAENNLEYNNVNYKRLKQRLELLTASSSVSDDRRRVHKLMQKVRFVHFHQYNALLSMARVVLDTYPYGGQSHKVFYCDNNVLDLGFYVPAGALMPHTMRIQCCFMLTYH